MSTGAAVENVEIHLYYTFFGSDSQPYCTNVPVSFFFFVSVEGNGTFECSWDALQFCPIVLFSWWNFLEELGPPLAVTL